MPASTAIDETADRVDKTIKDAEKNINDMTERAQRTIQEGLETLRVQARAYADTAGDSIDVAQRYVCLLYTSGQPTSPRPSRAAGWRSAFRSGPGARWRRRAR